MTLNYFDTLCVQVIEKTTTEIVMKWRGKVLAIMEGEREMVMLGRDCSPGESRGHNNIIGLISPPPHSERGRDATINL